ncbi:hypothetical protein FQA39_LY05798 [Lamprigera yunnana]|nr:hypothetical protein FQA39_LY05798 [Lamprigera yunnana]
MVPQMGNLDNWLSNAGALLDVECQQERNETTKSTAGDLNSAREEEEANFRRVEEEGTTEIPLESPDDNHFIIKPESSECSVYGIANKIHSEDSKTKINLNQLAVSAMISTEGGFTQLEEMCGVMSISSMSYKT